VARQVEPDFDILAAVAPFAKEALSQDLPAQAKSVGAKTLTDLLRLLEESPRALTDILRRAGHGEFRMAVRPTDYDRVVDQIDAMLRRFGMVLLVAAMFLGTSIIVALRQGKGGLGLGAMLILVFTVVTAIALVVGTLRREHRAKKTHHGR